jgi:hypothetical protein
MLIGEPTDTPITIFHAPKTPASPNYPADLARSGMKPARNIAARTLLHPRILYKFFGAFRERASAEENLFKRCSFYRTNG